MIIQKNRLNARNAPAAFQSRYNLLHLQNAYTMDNAITLYGTSACHLCEEAYAMLEPLAQALELHLQQVDIADNDALLETYGMYIPVLSTHGVELRWPFDMESAKAFLCTEKTKAGSV